MKRSARAREREREREKEKEEGEKPMRISFVNMNSQSATRLTYRSQMPSYLYPATPMLLFAESFTFTFTFTFTCIYTSSLM